MASGDEGLPPFVRMRRATWQMIVVTIASVACFVTGMLYAKHTAAALDKDAADIATNASPSIASLSQARGAMLRAEVAAARAASTPDRAADERLAAQEAVKQTRAAEDDYLSQPFFPNEHEHWTAVAVATDRFEETLARFFDTLQANRLEAANTILRDELRPATERLDAAMQFLVTFNAGQQARIALEIPRLRERASRVADSFDAASIALAALLIALVVRESRRRTQLLTHFGGRLEEIVAANARVTGALLRHEDERAVLDAIVAEACRIVDADYAALGFMVERERPFADFVAYGFSPAERAAAGHPPRPIGVLGVPIAEGEPLRLDDVTRHPQFRGWPPGHPAMGAFLGVPVRRDGHGNGNLYLARRPGRAAFSQEDEHVIELLAAQAAASAESAALYRRLERQRTRAQLLADASERMTGSIAYDATLQSVARVAVPSFADACVVYLSTVNGGVERMVTAAHDPELRAMLDDVAARLGGPTPRHPAVQALAERRAVRCVLDGEMIDRMAQNEEHRRLLERLANRHLLCVPLIGGKQPLGTINFVAARDGGFGDEDVVFAEELAHRAALSIDNAILHDRTERAVRTRNDVLAIVSHDLRNPLTSIRMNAGMLKRASAGSDEKRVALADRITRTTDAMTRLIEDLLAAAKLESGSFTVEAQPQPVMALIGEAVEMFRDAAAARAIALRAEVDDVVGEVVCDRDRVLQVLSNLVGNALKFTPNDGAITLSVHAQGDEARFAVADSGPGIPESEREHVFDRYWQASHTRRAGAGLGLFIVKGIVEAHGGRVWAEASATGGACLCFTLPSCRAVAAQAPEARSEGLSRIGGPSHAE